jgi:hypothetical protein
MQPETHTDDVCTSIDVLLGHRLPWNFVAAVPTSGDIAMRALQRIQEVTFDKRARLIADAALAKIERGGV